MLIHDNPFERVGHIEDARPVLFQVKVEFPCRRRSEPRGQAKELGTITNGIIYDIYAEKNGWGQLEDGSWIALSYTKKI